jgi:DNA polymerase (family 10)
LESANNLRVAAVLQEIADLLELKGEGAFKVRAYENAARTLRHLPEDVASMEAQGRLRSIQGIGDALSAKISEFLKTGSITYLDKLQEEFPPGVRALMLVPGVGPKLAARVYRELDVETLDQLSEAARDGRIASLPRLGSKSAENLIRAIERAQSQDYARTPIGEVLPYVQSLVAHLATDSSIRNVMVAGSLRRFRETVRDVDIIGTSDAPDSAFDMFVTMPGIVEVIARGPTKLSVRTDRGLSIDFRIVPHECFGSLLQHFTGSAAHNVQLREYALKRGQSLSEYGITNVETSERLTFVDEAAFYAALDLAWIPPELREGIGEIGAARSDALPHLVMAEDIHGDLHMHTNWSDGKATIREMVQAARGRGYEYIAITDHSVSRGGNPGGLSAERLERQQAALDEVQSEFPDIRILHGTEVDIRNDGALDFDDEVLAKLDWVVASVHSTFSMDRERMTARIVKAVRNPHVDCLGHPTGRILGRRPPYDLDMDAVFEAAARSGTAIEVNSFPQRLDLKDTHVKGAIAAGVRICINTDAHTTGELAQIDYGLSAARRGWAQPQDIINAMPLRDLLRALGHGA